MRTRARGSRSRLRIGSSWHSSSATAVRTHRLPHPRPLADPDHMGRTIASKHDLDAKPRVRTPIAKGDPVDGMGAAAGADRVHWSWWGVDRFSRRLPLFVRGEFDAS